MTVDNSLSPGLIDALPTTRSLIQHAGLRWDGLDYETDGVDLTDVDPDDSFLRFCKTGGAPSPSVTKSFPAGTAIVGPQGALVDDGSRRWWCRGSGAFPPENAPDDVHTELDTRQAELDGIWSLG